jgi:1,4-alpha-glucan branching enzyme
MVSRLDDGRFRFRIYLPHASRVELVGGFTRWRDGRIAMEFQEPGWWELVAELPVGEHEFCYLVDNKVWLADYAASGVRLTGDGGWVSKLLVHPVLSGAAA